MTCFDEQYSGLIYSYKDIGVIRHKITIGTSRMYYSESNTDQQINGEHCGFYLCLL